MKYKSFREQMIECVETGNQVQEKCFCCGHTLLVCLKYGGQCISGKCVGERIRKE